MTRDQELSQAFDAGNYAAAYETPYYSEAIGRLSMNRSAAYIQAFTLGYFADCELHEMSDQTAYENAYHSRAGQRCVKLGYVEPLGAERSAV